MAGPIHLSKLDARRLHRRAVLLDTPRPDIQSVLAKLGFVQLDPINVCGRMQDLILRNRVEGYREGDLTRHLHGLEGDLLGPDKRQAFEHHLPHTNVLAALQLEAWPYLLAEMRGRSRGEGSWSGKLDSRQQLLSKRILAQILAQGPLCSDDIESEERQHHGWGSNATLAKVTLHKLFFHGRLLIAKRVGNRRYYDLPERVLPRRVLACSEPSEVETKRWTILLKLRQRRLVRLSPVELRFVADHVQRIEVEGCPALYCMPEDLPLLELRETPERITLLAPLDPLIYDRRTTRDLWNFDYTWEVYTPPARRVRGYYALPVLAGLELVGHVDPKADRSLKKLKVMKRSIRRGHSTADALRELARFLGFQGES